MCKWFAIHWFDYGVLDNSFGVFLGIASDGIS
jgi:hypothetical protein